MAEFKLRRRSFLHGAGGAALALPALEIMGGRTARGGGVQPVKRFVMMYAGMSLSQAQSENEVVPYISGPGYDLRRGLLPLGNEKLPSNPGLGGTGLDVQDHVSIVSGLEIPWDTGSGIPLGGKSVEFHANSMGPQTSGVRSGPGRQEAPNGPTADQIVADAIAGDTPFRSLSYRVQAASYVGSNNAGGDSGRISWRANGAELEAIDPIFSPQQAYSNLFGNFIPPDPELAKIAAQRLEMHKGIVDRVKDDAEALSMRLGQQDRIRLEQHLDQLRELEIRLAATPPSGGDCAQPTDPGDDWPIAGAGVEYNGQGGDGAGYSDEDLRAEVLCDIINMAFACDLSRVAAVRMTTSQSHMQMGAVIGQDGDLHDHSHGGSAVGLTDCVGWHVKHFARLISLLRDTQDFDGSPLLDSTALVLLFEGGSGYDPESNTTGLPSPHSTENMIALVGGHGRWPQRQWRATYRQAAMAPGPSGALGHECRRGRPRERNPGRGRRAHPRTILTMASPGRGTATMVLAELANVAGVCAAKFAGDFDL